MSESSGTVLLVAGVALVAGAVGGYVVASKRERAAAEDRSRDAYRRGLQDGHNRLAHRVSKRGQRAREVAPRYARDTLPEGE